MSDEEPSRVLHLRNVTSEVSHADLQNLASPFGKVQNIVLLRDKNQALIQMDSVAAASAVLNFYTTGYTEVGGRRVYLKYSRHQELTGKAAAQGNGVSQSQKIKLSTNFPRLHPAGQHVQPHV